MEDEIKESESRRPTIDTGKVRIDGSNNKLEYGDGAVIVNVSAYSIKHLYAKHNTNLLSRNLRYHVAGREIDKAIAETISRDPDTFWLKNNGITIICEDFKVDGREVKLKNFSIVNGGQTTYMLHKSTTINSENDLFLPCKIIKIIGDTEDEKNQFSLSIAKAANSQKAIRKIDLKANSPEQVRFSQAMREVGVFYQTKRGETVPRAFREPYLNTDLVEIGKLCLAAVFQLPCASRSKPSSLYQEKYYDPIFNGNQSQIARLCKELLYFDHYFRTSFQRNFDRENAAPPDANLRISFAHNARTICNAFVAFAARYWQGNITEQDLTSMFAHFAHSTSENIAETMYETYRDLGNMRFFLPPYVFDNKDLCDSVLSKLFNVVISAGITCYVIARKYDNALTPTNYLKKDNNYYEILCAEWSKISADIKRIFAEAEAQKFAKSSLLMRLLLGFMYRASLLNNESHNAGI